MDRHVLHIRDSSGIYGGERVILTLGRAISKGNRFRFSLLCMRRADGRSQALIEMARMAGIDVHPVDVDSRMDIGAVGKIREFIRDNKVSVIHTHDFKSDFYGLLATRNLDVKRVATAHGSTRDSILKRLYLFFDERLIYRYYDKIIAVSEELQTQLMKKNVPPGAIEVIQNGLDMDLLGLRREVEEPPLPIEKKQGMKIFGVIGRLYPDKGQSHFLDAFKAIADAFPHCYGVMVGDGPDFERLSQEIKSLHLEYRVHLCGVRKDMKKVYETIDYLVIPSFTEGLPYVLLEAMAGGVPVLATAVGDIPMLVEDGRTGFLVPPGDVAALSGRMRGLLEDERLARTMAKEAQALVQKRYSAKRMVEQTESLYSSLFP
jgi:glycosyltransferase involved in cell wall biosynthesis